MNPLLSRILSVVLASAASAMLCSCALTRDTVTLQHTPAPGAPRIAGAGCVTVHAQDQRMDQSRVGCKKNGYGMEMAAIQSEKQVADVFRSALESELAQRGFKMGGGRQVDVKVYRFYNDFKIGFFAGDAVADLDMEVAVRGTSYSRRVVTQGKEPNIQIASGSNAKAALEDALNRGMFQLLADPAFLGALK